MSTDPSYIRQSVGLASDSPFLDAKEALEQCRRRMTMPALKSSARVGGYKWTIPSLQMWLSCTGSSLVVINGGLFNKLHMQELCIDLIDLLQEKESPVVWLLRADSTEETSQHPTAIAALKYLILQLIQLPHMNWNQTLMTSVSAILKESVSEDECFVCLGSVLGNSGEIFIIMDSMAELVGLSSIFWSTKLLDIFKSFNNTNTQHSIKVAFISYGTTQTVPEAIKAEWKDRLIVIQSPINRPFSYSQKRHPPSSLAKLRDEERSQLAETIKKLYCAKQNEIIELSSGVNSENLSPDKLFLNQDQELHSSFGQFEMYLNPPSTTTIEPMLAPFPSHPETGYSMQGSYRKPVGSDVSQFIVPDGQQFYTNSDPMNQVSASTGSLTPYRRGATPEPTSIMGLDLEAFDQKSGIYRQAPHRYDMASTFHRPQRRSDFEIALICALRVEFDAVEALFDEYYEDDFSFGKSAGDPNAYTVGRITNHNVVLAFMPGMGKANSASLAASFRASFSGIKVGLVVGICGGVPLPQGTDDETEIILGDVVISTGLVQFDFGRQYLDKVVRKNTLEDNLGRPNREIRAFLAKLSGARSRRILREKTSSYLTELCGKNELHQYQYPGAENDRLYHPEYRHKHRDPLVCNICAACHNLNDEVCSVAMESSCQELHCQDAELITRVRVQNAKNDTLMDSEEAPKPLVHFGLIASGDLVMKSGYHRDRIASQEKVIAFEMEGAGVWDVFPTVVIKSVCDYADSHKNKKWQQYAAATAACCMKAFLSDWRRSDQLGVSLMFP